MMKHCFLRQPIRLVLSLLIANFVFLLSSPNTFADPSLNLTIENESIVLNVTNHSVNGTFAKSTSNTISVTTNNYTGYTLSVKSDDSTNLASENGGVIQSIDAPISEALFSANSTESAIYNGKWGYLPSKFNSVANSDFRPAPSLTGDVIDSTNTPNTEANTYTFAIGTRINDTVEPGSYVGSITVFATANLINYSITYDDNAPDGEVSNMPDPNPQSGSVDVSTTSITLSSNVPTRDGYEFQGWCASPEISTEETADGVRYFCKGILAGAGEFVLIDPRESNSITLYALWLPKLYDKVASMSKGTQTAQKLQDPITSENSGVYEYDEDEFGDPGEYLLDPQKIYYYRGILDSTTSGQTGAGLADVYPNYVAALSTNSGYACWRIVRTTAWGGIKAIYFGHRNSDGECTIAPASAYTTVFNGSRNDYRTPYYVNYSHNGKYSSSTANTISSLYGPSSGQISKIPSIIGGTIEAINEFDIIIPVDQGTFPAINAGYCNDRTVYRAGSEALEPVTTIITSGTEYHFGAYERNAHLSQTPSLACPRDFDLIGPDNSDLSFAYHLGLLTADEASFAGSGSSTATNGSSSSPNSYLNIGVNFWTMSPHSLSSNGNARMFYINTNGALANAHVGNEFFVARPVVTIWEGATIIKGTGTRTDPWILNQSDDL